VRIALDASLRSGNFVQTSENPREIYPKFSLFSCAIINTNSSVTSQKIVSYLLLQIQPLSHYRTWNSILQNLT